ncbi:hypothetical protein CPB83DRAFT_845883 [Crepidotus variabilis]|uniref:Uncharacterized protein n=1 Tax=Crepidotus variabilis TaxID=179855 RepID=A0A9P6JU63_9AGAR|nr:hypothetical protein CPB83DRAFT_845883 [Crepidotus variabilis]
MATHKIVVNIQEKALKDLLRNGSKLCMARGVIDADGEETYNVVAYADAVSSVNTITFVDTYSMLGTTQEFQEGRTLQTDSSITLPIDFQQVYDLHHADSALVDNSPAAPKDGFAFINDVKASAVVCLRSGPILNSMSEGAPNCPIFISPNPEVPSTTKLIPTDRVALWFQHGIKTATMICFSHMRHCCVIKLKGTTEAVMTYTDDYNWISGSGSTSDSIKEGKA